MSRIYRSGSRKEWANEGTRQADYGRLSASMAVGTGIGIPRGFVVMKQTSDKAENEDHNNGKFLDWEPPLWILKSHRVYDSLAELAAVVYKNLEETQCSVSGHASLTNGVGDCLHRNTPRDSATRSLALEFGPHTSKSGRLSISLSELRVSSVKWALHATSRSAHHR